ncbi:Gamma-glutamylputrescine oxidoreductase [Methylobacterium crusticola]|uniref:Gamma-glutamylputrescine oxidoreductase n=1 Tax=Methylobacterium crusticola TaxID=1697972 RepID=A0ABQ4R8G5_9HYPH|nr:FAD-binding oxidoreductase [Methylobacterium crusticola]GJD53017.1 Gamma-glutamylputrescine oxidoreductase [Methylobacterium crusticola]
MSERDAYWWQAAPLASAAARPVAGTCDVVVVGAGYTGLSAALTLARAGRSVQVFDKMRPGEGASTRNGGITSGNLRPSRAEMVRRFGEARADAILAESKAAREDLYAFIAREGLDCDFALVGRFAGAATPEDYEGLARDAEHLHRVLGIDAHAVPRAEQRAYIGTDYYHGGNVRMDIGGLHPAKFHAGMLRLAEAAGAVVHGETAVRGVRPEGSGYEVATARGTVRAGHVIVGTNGYTDASDAWLRRRLVPVRSRIIATAPLSPNLMGALMPTRMMYTETRKLHYYYRPSPDGTRILFGGRDGTVAGDPDWPTANLRRALADIFPELDGGAITHSWYGHVAMNRDMVPRIFTRRGLRYAAGYCGSGVVWARWAGQKAALQVLGDQAGDSALAFRPPGYVPLLNGRAWFMPGVFAWYSLQDRLAARRVARRRA